MSHMAGITDSSLAAWWPLESGKPPTSWGMRRRCQTSGCDTVLSRYNPATTCAAHGGWQRRRTGGHDRR